MSGKARYRVYGVVDEETEGIDYLLDEIRQYGTAFVVEVEAVDKEATLPDAEDDFKAHYAKK